LPPLAARVRAWQRHREAVAAELAGIGRTCGLQEVREAPGEDQPAGAGTGAHRRLAVRRAR
jgi:hypothetical protein